MLLAACARAYWAVWSRIAAVHNVSTCLHTCRRVRVHGCAPVQLGLLAVCGCYAKVKALVYGAGQADHVEENPLKNEQNGPNL